MKSFIEVGCGLEWLLQKSVRSCSERDLLLASSPSFRSSSMKSGIFKFIAFGLFSSNSEALQFGLLLSTKP